MNSNNAVCNLAGKRVAVTGATGGIGKRVLDRLVAAGVEVVATGRNPERLAALIGRAASIRTHLADFNDSQSCENCANELASRYKLDGFVLIYPSVLKSEEIIPPPAGWREAMDLCFVNPLGLLRAGVEAMQPGGRIVIVSGVASVQVFPALAYSNAIRAAWLAEAKLLSQRLGERQIRVNTVSLGGTLTEAFEAKAANRPSTSQYDDVPENIPLGRYGSPENVADVIVGLLSYLSDHMTGANLVIDGGLTRSY